MLTSSLFLLAVCCSYGATNAASTPKAAAPDTPWDTLQAVLSSPDILTDPDVSEWKSQCLDPFINDPFNEDFPAVSAYQLYEQPSGTCMVHAACIFPGCFLPGIGPTYPLEEPAYLTAEDTVVTDAFDTIQDNDLPARVLHPNTASDIVQAIRFCEQYNVGVTVKVAGHSFFGASTAAGTLLIKMTTNYPKYAIEGSLLECSTMANTTMVDDTSANAMACAVATARNKSAVMRTGGGELFDHAYRAVSFDWNAANPDSMYHLVGGAAGTVSAAGGWLQSGGLSGTTGMRAYGLGVDQVLHLEMVLPSGTHVRFGPSAWEQEDGFVYPRTTSVTGYCNANPLEMDESLWEWTSCEDDINFDDLWFAVRGGGGGTFGVVVSLHYQLHDYPGPLQGVVASAESLPQVEGFDWGATQAFTVTDVYILFLFKFLFTPSELNVTEAESNNCNAAKTAALSPFLGALFYCYGTSGTTMVSAWEAYITSAAVVDRLTQAGIPAEIVGALDSFFSVFGEVPSYAHLIVADGSDAVPAGRLPDAPKASVPVDQSFPDLTDSRHVHFPIEALIDDMETISQLVAVDVLTFESGAAIYPMGGAIRSSTDQTTSLSPIRRSAGFLKAVLDEETRNAYYDIIYGNGDGTPFVGDVFPGSSCHNHALVYEMGPLKNDWTKSCPVDWPQEERVEKCISQNEAAWGTTNLARLDAINANVDPNGIFICTSGIGFMEESSDTGSMLTESPASMLTESPASMPTESPTSIPTESDTSAAFAWKTAGFGFYPVVVLLAILSEMAATYY